MVASECGEELDERMMCSTLKSLRSANRYFFAFRGCLSDMATALGRGTYLNEPAHGVTNR